MGGAHADAVRASITAHDPAAAATLADSMDAQVNPQEQGTKAAENPWLGAGR